MSTFIRAVDENRIQPAKKFKENKTFGNVDVKNVPFPNPNWEILFTLLIKDKTTLEINIDLNDLKRSVIITANFKLLVNFQPFAFSRTLIFALNMTHYTIPIQTKTDILQASENGQFHLECNLQYDPFYIPRSIDYDIVPKTMRNSQRSNESSFKIQGIIDYSPSNSLYCCFIEMINCSPILLNYFKKDSKFQMIKIISSILKEHENGTSIRDFETYCNSRRKLQQATFTEFLEFIGEDLRNVAENIFGVYISNHRVPEFCQPFLEVDVDTKQPIAQLITQKIDIVSAFPQFLFVTIKYKNAKPGLINFQKDLKFQFHEEKKNYKLQSILVYDRSLSRYELIAYDKANIDNWNFITGQIKREKKFNDVVDEVYNELSNYLIQGFLYKLNECSSLDL